MPGGPSSRRHISLGRKFGRPISTRPMIAQEFAIPGTLATPGRSPKVFPWPSARSPCVTEASRSPNVSNSRGERLKAKVALAMLALLSMIAVIGIGVTDTPAPVVHHDAWVIKADRQDELSGIPPPRFSSAPLPARGSGLYPQPRTGTSFPGQPRKREHCGLISPHVRVILGRSYTTAADHAQPFTSGCQRNYLAAYRHSSGEPLSSCCRSIR